ncbi:MAG: hypothetical protein KAI43_07320 [Candidatus Aureabacteria bacterium]|nr:hypothetical protein [Candidatus Auribacterota bacterium]
MAAPKLRLVFYEDKKEVKSYFYLERNEGLRVIELLKILPELKQWTPLSKTAEKLNVSPLVLQWTILKLAGAKHIDIKVDDKRKIIAKAPIILIRKEKYNTRNNLSRYKFLRPTIYIRCGRVS